MTRIGFPAALLSRRSTGGRLAALLWALAFVLGTAGEGFGLHPCPHHGSGEGDAPSVLEGDHSAHASTATGGTSHHAPADPHSGPCTCGSVCQAAAGTALPVRADIVLTDAVAESGTAIVASTGLLVASRAPHFLPFAQAPPRAG
ncbi:MAG TPA: hypothetical protein VFZ18_04220 [Longimicrobiaceae bacterium]